MEIGKQRNQSKGAARWVSVLGGGAAMWFGLRRRSLFGSVVALAGANYVLRGLTGQRDVSGIKIRRSVTINKPVEELYRFWRNFENLPRFMKHLESVRVLDSLRSHWVVRPPGGRKVEWDTEIVAERENELIGWRSVNGMVNHAGSVRFERALGGRGSVVRVQLQYNPPRGRIGASFATLFGEGPDRQIKEDLYQFKRMMEGGTGGAEVQREPVREPEPVEIASEESFPASDAPAWTAGGGA
jgi:uncharacterized membrane protein